MTTSDYILKADPAGAIAAFLATPVVTLPCVPGTTELRKRGDRGWSYCVRLDTDPRGEAIGGTARTASGAAFKAWRVRRKMGPSQPVTRTKGTMKCRA